MRRISILLFGLSIVVTPLYAHHGRGATYDMKKRVTLKGSVSRVDWRTKSSRSSNVNRGLLASLLATATMT